MTYARACVASKGLVFLSGFRSASREAIIPSKMRMYECRSDRVFCLLNQPNLCNTIREVHECWQSGLIQLVRDIPALDALKA